MKNHSLSLIFTGLLLGGLVGHLSSRWVTANQNSKNQIVDGSPLPPHSQRESNRANQSSTKSAVKNSEGRFIKKGFTGEFHINSDLLHIDPAAAYEQLIKRVDISPERYKELLDHVLTVWAQKDPTAASLVIQNLSSKALKNSLLVALASGWAEKDIPQAFTWLSSIEDHDIPDEVMVQCYTTVMVKYAKSEPLSAAKILADLESRDIQLQLLGSVLSSYVNHDSQQAGNWLLSLKDKELRSAGADHILNQMIEDSDSGLLEMVISNHSSLNPETVAHAFSLLPKEQLPLFVDQLSQIDLSDQASITTSMANNWLTKDESTALQWFSTQPPGIIYDSGAESIANRLSRKSPSTAISWANTISNPAQRFATISNIAKSAQSEKLYEVQESINDLHLSDEEQSSLMAVIEQRIQSASAQLIIPH